MKALLALNERTLELFDDYADAGVEFEMHRTGLLLVARTPEGLASYKAVFRELKTVGFGGETTELGPGAAAELEPALDRTALAGGVHARVDRYVRPETLTAGLAAHLTARGVEIRAEG